MSKDLDDRKVQQGEETIVVSPPAQRQAVEVKPMRYVLGIGLGLVILGMVAAYLSV